ncbi:PH domain-containing protein [Ructibacterium gallinarum]|uniref:GRAM domain-containing protein n=1 Tax=Ructibacterium gallinarum TaxID=2779355 RepID=A0A9D5LZY3_9FIRM|nr:hypothetical protein [Ructibacterium gallinarum]MBE5041163.1 hypothetical protein [Ructibacterium gallinarum]
MEYDFLMPGEQVIMMGAANKRQAGGIASKGGHLYLTNQRLVFKAHAFNLGSSFDEIPFSKIAFTGNTLNLLMPTPNMIRVNTTDGKNHGFIVTGKQKEQWKQKISEVVQEYKNNGENSQQATSTNDEIVTVPPALDTNQSNVQEQKNIYNSEKVQETMDKLKESAENVSTAVKEKAKQAVQQSQEFIQSDQFQNAKNEAVKNTKNFIQRFFECNINSQEDFTRAELRRKRCLCVVFAMIAASIFLFSFYDEYYWFDGVWYSIMKFASFLSSMSRILLVPVCIIALIKYYYVNKEIKRYQSENPDVQTHDMHTNKKAMVITLVICIICVPVVSKINDMAYQNDSSTKSNEKVSDIETSKSNDVATDTGNRTSFKTNLTDDEIINCAVIVFENTTYSPKTPKLVDYSVIGQDKYGRCAALLYYDFGNGTRTYVVFVDGLDKDNKVHWATNSIDERSPVQETMNNSQLTQTLIESMKEQYNWNQPR